MMHVEPCSPCIRFEITRCRSNDGSRYRRVCALARESGAVKVEAPVAPDEIFQLFGRVGKIAGWRILRSVRWLIGTGASKVYKRDPVNQGIPSGFVHDHESRVQ